MQYNLLVQLRFCKESEMRFRKTKSEVQDGVWAWRTPFGVPSFTCALGSSLIKFNCVLRDLSLNNVSSSENACGSSLLRPPLFEF